MTKRTTINYMLLGGGGSPEKNTFLILAKHQRTRQSDNGNVELGRVNLVGISVRSMKSDYAGGLPCEFSTRSRKTADFRKHLRQCLERQKNQRQTEN